MSKLRADLWMSTVFCAKLVIFGYQASDKIPAISLRKQRADAIIANHSTTARSYFIGYVRSKKGADAARLFRVHPSTVVIASKK